MGATLNSFIEKFNHFQSLKPGEPFTIRVTDAEATDAAKEYIEENKDRIKELIQKKADVGLDVADPKVSFREGEFSMSAKGGKGVVKVKGSVCADVKWENGLKVNVKKVDVPIIKISPEKLNFVVREPLDMGMRMVEKYARIRSFEIKDGYAVLEAVRA